LAFLRECVIFENVSYEIEVWRVGGANTSLAARSSINSLTLALLCATRLSIITIRPRLKAGTAVLEVESEGLAIRRTFDSQRRGIVEIWVLSRS